MPVIQSGNINPLAILNPDVYVQLQPPAQLVARGLPTNTIYGVGTAPWGEKNVPVPCGGLDQALASFGQILNEPHDICTFVAVAQQKYVNNFVLVRITDGTDTHSSVSILDTTGGTPLVGAILSGIYSGAYGNNIQVVIGAGSNSTNASPSYKVSISLPNSAPETFDNITGTGVDLWSNIVNAINSGQQSLSGPSQIVVAALNSFLSGVTITAAGSYATMPTPGTTGAGAGAAFNLSMKSVAVVPATPGTGYVVGNTITPTGGIHSVNSVWTVDTTRLVNLAVLSGGANFAVGDTIVLAGGTFNSPASVTVSAVSAGAITAVTISNPGSYTVNTATFTQGSTSGVGTGATFNTAAWGVNTASVTTPGVYTTLPASPVAQGATSGSGTGATFNALWGALSVAVATPGAGYNSTSAFTLTGGGGTGGGAGTLSIGSAAAPNLATYTLSGGTNGNTGVTPQMFVGSDAYPRTAMYALRNSGIGVGALINISDPDTFAAQNEFGLQEGIEMIATGQIGQSMTDFIATRKAMTANSYAFKYLKGDWEVWYDATNNVERYISQQAIGCSRLSSLTPNQSGLNKPINGVAGTQYTKTKQRYSANDIVLMMQNGVDVVAAPSPGGNYFSLKTGKNTSLNLLESDDSYSRLTPFIAFSLNAVAGTVIGELQTTSVRDLARNTIITFLANLERLGWIGDVNGGKAFSVVLDSSNNPNGQVALGIMQADVRIVTLKVIYVFLINMEIGDVSITDAKTSLQGSFENNAQNRARLIR